ncbi:MAG: MFS transporter [Terrimicrobiaceae bacterium]|nr:MFS transporter [Terrimicrobiaceae bacterium]
MHLATRRAPIPAADRIPLLQKVMFSAGYSMDYIATGMIVSLFWMPFFNIGLGINPAVLGLVLMILQGWNAILDPVMGNLSDNARTRWGRRRPFMVAGAALTAAVSPWIWRPPTAWGETGIIVYLAGIGMVFYACFSCWAMPFYGMQLELTPNYDERSRLTAWLTLFGKLTGLLGGWGMAIVTSSWFADPVTGKADIVHGVKTCSWFLAGLMLVSGLLPPLFVKERYYESEAKHQARDPFWQSIRESMQCGPLWRLIGISFFLVVGCYAVGTLGQYVSIYFVNRGDLAAASVIGGWKATALMVTGILCIPLYTWLGERFDKKIMVAAMLGVSMFGHTLNIICMTPAMPYLQIVPGIFESGAISALWLFLPSMKADVADYDELHTTRRREGALNAFYSWFIKAALTCSMGLGGLVLQISGFNVKLAHEQPPEVLHRMLLLYVTLPLIVWACGLAFVWRYPLDRHRMAEIRGDLERRRGRL